MFPRRTKDEIKHLCNRDRKVSKTNLLPSTPAELLVHFFQISPTSRSRYCTDYLYDLKGTNKEYADQSTTQYYSMMMYV
jgi:hypothetical protein